MDTLDDSAIAHIAEYFQALSEPMRLKVLNLLRSGHRNVGEIAEQLGCTTANVSKHLSLLAKSGFVERTVKGNAAYYQIADPGVFELCNVVCGQVGKRLVAQSKLAEQLVSVQQTATGEDQK